MWNFTGETEENTKIIVYPEFEPSTSDNKVRLSHSVGLKQYYHTQGDVKKEWSYTSTTPYVLKAWCLISTGGHFTFSFIIFIYLFIYLSAISHRTALRVTPGCCRVRPHSI
jgi:hypothetical protein